MIAICDFVSHAGFGLSKGECPQCTPDLSRPIAAPGPIAEAMADSRKLRWRRMEQEFPAMVRLGYTYIGARYNEETRVWMLGRVTWCEECSHWEVAQNKAFFERDHSEARITHFADDILGTP